MGHATYGSRTSTVRRRTEPMLTEKKAHAVLLFSNRSAEAKCRGRKGMFYRPSKGRELRMSTYRCKICRSIKTSQGEHGVGKTHASNLPSSIPVLSLTMAQWPKFSDPVTRRVACSRTTPDNGASNPLQELVQLSKAAKNAPRFSNLQW